MTTGRVPNLDRLITIPTDRGQPLSANPWGGQAAYAEAATGRVWAERRDFTGKDTLEISQGKDLDIDDTRYTIRAELGTALKAGDTLTDENGDRVTVRGIAQIGRRYLELLTRRIG